MDHERTFVQVVVAGLQQVGELGVGGELRSHARVPLVEARVVLELLLQEERETA
jgi:hypothetical protein